MERYVYQYYIGDIPIYQLKGEEPLKELVHIIEGTKEQAIRAAFAMLMGWEHDTNPIPKCRFLPDGKPCPHGHRVELVNYD